MNKRVEAVIEAASKLSPKEKIEVARRIMQAARAGPPDIDESWLQLAREQMAAYDRGELELYDADEVLAEMRAWSQARRAKQRAKS